MGKECKNCSLADIGYCHFVQEVQNQAKGRQWNPNSWRSYLGRMKKDILPGCQEADSLRRAMYSSQPNFIAPQKARP